MSATKRSQSRRPRARVDLNAENSALLDEAAQLFQLPRAEVLRRLVRAAVDVGPALSAENLQIVAALAQQTRAAGYNLSQLLRAIRSGRAVMLDDARPIIEALHASIRAIDQELTAITIAYGARLRGAAGLTSSPS